MNREINNPFDPIYFDKLGKSYSQFQEENLSQVLESLDSAMKNLYFSYTLESNYNSKFDGFIDEFKPAETMNKLKSARQAIKDFHDMMNLQFQKEKEANATKAFLEMEDKNV